MSSRIYIPPVCLVLPAEAPGALCISGNGRIETITYYEEEKE